MQMPTEPSQRAMLSLMGLTKSLSMKHSEMPSDTALMKMMISCALGKHLECREGVGFWDPS